MRCERCRGTGDDPELRDLLGQVVPCWECGGCGQTHCCGGDQAQPDDDDSCD